MNTNLSFIENVPWRSPLKPLENFKLFFENKRVCDLGCGSGDTILAFNKLFNCKECYGIDWTDRANKNIEKHNLNIVKSDILNYKFEGTADTYYIWIENPCNEIKIIERLLLENSDCNIIIAYNTKGFCQHQKLIKNQQFNPDCAFCRYLGCIPHKLNILTSFLQKSEIKYSTKTYEYNDGNECRQSGEITYIVINHQASNR